MALRWRIIALVAAATCAVAAAVGVLVHQASRGHELSQARQAARTTLDRAADAYARTGEVRGSGAELDSPDVPDGLRELVADGRYGSEFTDGPGGPAMWAARPAGGRVLSVRVDMRTSMRDIGTLDTNIVVAGLVATAVVLPLGAVTAGRMSRKLRTAAGTARRIAAGDLNARIDAKPRRNDEIAEISGAVDSMAAALQERLRREQRFTGDVAHELRTPLMGLVTAAELLPDDEAVGYVRDRSRVLSTLVDELLEISRLDAHAEHADLTACAVGPLVEEAVARTGVRASLRTEPPRAGGRTGTGASGRTGADRRAAATVGGKPGDGESEDGEPGDGVRTVDDEPVKVWTDPRRLARVVANLLLNADRHGHPPVEVTVSADGRTVTVRDHGPGYPEDLLRDGPQRFRTGAAERGRGHGLGLTIARGQAEVLGATLEFGNAADGGAVATVRLPATEGPPIHG
ncbi:HAMP domain-containing sensor histidine kinase [Streptomyces sp. Z26]|uniref:HAMP domain-containing sensor histidine kinase n=1 Tax=Streptomyces sp. Z26 TaxID=2500177 RepID=UPI000EF16F8F|nr:HAMP domain-containing sensor histidine kinase [Streptomyces sp. Z26]RLL67588.1 sensor histidine kinase [Streptomyces sp. Z26]